MIFIYLYSWGEVSNASNEREEHIQIIITSAQKADNVIPTLERSISTVWVRVIKTISNIEISPSLYISRGV